MKERISSAHVLAIIAIVLALGGNALAFHLGKNSVGSKQLKKNAVTTAKIRNEAVTGAKVKRGTLTGAQIDSATLGTVPMAATANTSNVAASVTPPEPWHEVGSSEEPQFQHGCENNSPDEQTVRFYKDHEDVVHLEGRYQGCNANGDYAFQLPAGYRPGSESQFGPPDAGVVTAVFPTYDAAPTLSGAVACGGSTCFLNGITFRAES